MAPYAACKLISGSQITNLALPLIANNPARIAAINRKMISEISIGFPLIFSCGKFNNARPKTAPAIQPATTLTAAVSTGQLKEIKTNTHKY